ncbi:kinesin motor domain protein [Cooperia oncophora]
MVEDKISVVARIRPGFGDGHSEWIKNGERNIMKKDGTEIYTFDEVFDQLCTNVDIYDGVMKGIVDSALAGFNTAVCAYGQSGAGKTHTLTGSDVEDGVVQKTFRALFETIAKSEDRNYMLRISYVEIYNERVRDLLSENVVDLPIYENKDGVAQIEGLKEVVVTEIAEVESLLVKAQEHRQLGETLLNERSSRSHTIIRLTIESHDVKIGGNATRCSIMNLVDLAGSENAAAAGTQGLRQKEGANINRSLLALSKVVSSLADNQKFIPFRDSKLTRILKPSLGGNSKTVIICCVAPFSISETNSTLKFAKLAKKIVTRPVVNEVNDDGLLSKYLREIELLKQELEKTKTKKESDEEERIREQRMKLSELMKGILNGRSTAEAASVLSRKARRQTWAPGNALLLLGRRGSLSPPSKRERVLGEIEETGGQASDEKIHTAGMDLEEKPDAGDCFLIPRFVPNERRSIAKMDTEVQTYEPYPIDRSDEVATLKKGNQSLAEQLSAKTKRCKELEEQKEEFSNAFESLKASVARFHEVESGALVLENNLKNVERENAMLNDEIARLREGNAFLKSRVTEMETNPEDRSRLLHRIDELHEELCRSRKAASQTKSDLDSCNDEIERQQILIESLRGELSQADSAIKEVREHYNHISKGWKEEKVTLLKKIEELSATASKDVDSLALEQENEIRSLKEALAASKDQTEAATSLAIDTRASLEKEFQERYSAVLKANEEELQQLRKDNSDLTTRIDMLLKNSGPGFEEEVMSLKEEIAELKDVIERKSKALEIAKAHQDELELCNRTMERLSREKKELTNRLNLKTENVEMLSSRVNALRDEINQIQCEAIKAKNARKAAEAAQAKVGILVRTMIDCAMIYALYKKNTQHSAANVDSMVNEKDTRISMLQEQVKSSQHKVLVLDTDLSIAQKDVERYKNTLSNMAKAQEARVSEQEESDIRNQLSVALDELKDAQSSEWPREKMRLTRQIEDLQGQLRDATEAHEQRQASIAQGRFHEERKRMADEIVRLREELSSAVSGGRASNSDKLPEVAKLKQDLQDTMKELTECKEKNRRYRMQKVNGIQYVDELKEKIAKLEKELQKTRQELSEKAEELQKVIKLKVQLESLVKEKENNPSKASLKG